MRFLLVIHIVLGLWAGLYAQEKFKMFTSRYGDEMPEEYAKEVRVYEEVGPNKWYCKVYDLESKYLLREYECRTLSPDTVHGFMKIYWQGEFLIKEGVLENDKWQGTQKTYYLNGQLQQESTYVDDKLEGPCKIYYPSGQLLARLMYRNHERVQWQYFKEDGTVLKKPMPDNFEPGFPGGRAALFKYLSSVPYPPEMKERNISGAVEVAFVVDTSGNVLTPTIRFSTDTAFSVAALKAFENMPRWYPAYKHAQKVKVFRVLSMYFNTYDEKNASLSRELYNQGVMAFGEGNFELAYDYFKEATYLDSYNNQAILSLAITAINLKRMEVACKCIDHLLFERNEMAAEKYLKYCDYPRLGKMPLDPGSYVLLPW